MFFITVLCFVLAFFPISAHAYIGPGAGFAFLGSAFVFIITILMAAATIAFWPLQWLIRKVTVKKRTKPARAGRVIIVGLDGLDPGLLQKYIAAGKLPNFEALSKEGSFSKLGTTLPPISPVAWSSFQTGVNPGAHNIFDFLTRDKRHYLPRLSSTETHAAARLLNVGKFIYPLKSAKISLLRKSQPFWKILGEYGVFANILRVPISYPPEKFKGNILSAMCTPDLKGTQGSYCFFTSNMEKLKQQQTGGSWRWLEQQNKTLRGELEGPPDPFLKAATALKIPFTLKVDTNAKTGLLEIDGKKEILKLEQLSSWIEISFRSSLGKKIPGICHFCLRSIDPDVTLYSSALNVNPGKPILPIAHPIFFSTYLAKRQGPFGTLGLLEDTWALNEQVLDDQLFLDQAYLFQAEREKMFFDLLKKTRDGLCVCVFDASDRIQHMFWRYLDKNHPAPLNGNGNFANTIPEMYQKMDQLVGKVRQTLRPNDLLIVMSDHGFTSFRRGINLNSWLKENGYLILKPGTDGSSDYFKDVDWSKTKAFALGLGGIYLNRVGRERQGCVTTEEAATIKAEISSKLEKLLDPVSQKNAVNHVYDAAKNYRGIYSSDAPDLFVGCKPGYRASWDSVTGKISADIFEDNTKAWSGDHCVDPKSVPGILLSNAKINSTTPQIVDIAPSVLDLFGVPIPKYMEGKPLFKEK